MELPSLPRAGGCSRMRLLCGWISRAAAIAPSEMRAVSVRLCAKTIFKRLSDSLRCVNYHCFGSQSRHDNRHESREHLSTANGEPICRDPYKGHLEIPLYQSTIALSVRRTTAPTKLHREYRALASHPVLPAVLSAHSLSLLRCGEYPFPFSTSPGGAHSA